MTRLEENSGYDDVERRLQALGRSPGSDPMFKAHLRDELLRRHQELTTETTQRGIRRFTSRLAGLKRLTLVAPPALAAAIAVSLVLSGLQVSGHRQAQGAEAARLSRALARTVPTLTAWRVSVQQRRGSAVQSFPCSLTLQDRHLYIRGTSLYIYAGRWFVVTPASVRASECPEAWMWAFSALHTSGNVSVSAGGRIQGLAAEKIIYPPVRARGGTAQSILWVDRSTGLVLRLQSTERIGTRVVEQDQVEYTYGLRRAP